MTKRFALPDRPTEPYFEIHAGGAVVLHVCPHGGGNFFEVWRDEIIMCRLFANSIEVADELTNHSFAPPKNPS